MILIGNELTKRFDSEDLVRKVDIFRDIAVSFTAGVPRRSQWMPGGLG